MAIKIVIANHKGGVGKTVTAVNTAHVLARRKYKVLLIDGDPQGNATMTLGGKPPFEYHSDNTLARVFFGEYLPLTELAIPTGYPNLDFIPNNVSIYSRLQALSTSSVRRFYGLEKSYQLSPDDYDFIIIDTQPTLEGSLLTNALVTADYVVVPIEAESAYAISGIGDLVALITTIKKEAESKTDIIGYLLTKFDGRKNACKIIQAAAKESFGEKMVFDSGIPLTTTINQAVMSNKPVCEFAPEAPACKAYNGFVTQLLQRIEADKAQ
ncbi:MAG: ParA family protein [Proteobacteria bacterium]|nr:ParA family protein [Pseudomonadota bacterium]